ncbi:ATP-binding cassette domain-containing protein [Tessaracoccus coleopterorum]|uniref:ATP-binding cassette domain-containing protein n=1 Tax=Tessaracoccus coleopterorum TaxID=2714950 RepID=UPI0018D3985A|nr:ATP-binding cassette domain-containing protein [Tessaracoccus coleopterorum]
MGWHPLPLTIREGRRSAAPQRSAWRENPPSLPVPAPRTSAALSARGIMVDYPEKLAVAGVDLTLHRGEIVALMGRNGCGKSSLMWAIQGPGAATAARWRWPSGSRSSPDPADLLYLTSVFAECGAGDAAADLEPGTTLALLRRLVPGIDGTSHPRDLSEGQKLAVVLAVELAGNPPVVLLDEPTRGLDYAAKAELSRIIGQLAAEGRAVLIATHDVEMVAQTCSRVVVMAEGEVVSDGPTRTVLADSALLATQVAKVARPTLCSPSRSTPMLRGESLEVPAPSSGWRSGSAPGS